MLIEKIQYKLFSHNKKNIDDEEKTGGLGGLLGGMGSWQKYDGELQENGNI